MKCLSCGFNKLPIFLTIKNAPPFVEKILSKKNVKSKKIILTLYRCEKCTLVQLPQTQYVGDEYYEDYLMSRTYSSFSKNYQRDLAKMFVGKFNLANKKIVDVGCGDGFFASCLGKENAKVTGIEPSKIAADLAKKRGLKIIQAQVDDKFKIKEKFDAFTACQVFEHIHKPGDLLKNIKKMLKAQAFGLIEVPSLVKSLKDNRFYDFFPDHVAYYSPTSLSYMIAQNNFDAIDVLHTANEEYITALIRLSKNTICKRNIQKDFINYKKYFKSFFSKVSGKKIALWGAGGKGVALVSFSGINSKDILFCIDSDPNKQGKFLSGNIEIASPDKLLKNRPEIVIVTAMMYKDEIVKTLKDKYKFKNKQIAVIAPIPRMLA